MQISVRLVVRSVLAYPVDSVLVSDALTVGVGALSPVAALYGVNDKRARRLRADLTLSEEAVEAHNRYLLTATYELARSERPQTDGHHPETDDA